VLEIREADAMDGSIHHVLVRMTDIGVKLSIDDFGLGTSSLVKLRRLPFSEIKIDRSFVGGLATNAEDLAIARSIVELGHGLDLTVVAEGVETRDAWSKLVELGCDRAQGFLICRPAPIAELESWLQTPAWGDRVR
jgi:EAL domain-containing protein (putative c-di-GMP-specific phosphodiesterase class I)